VYKCRVWLLLVGRHSQLCSLTNHLAVFPSLPKFLLSAISLKQVQTRLLRQQCQLASAAPLTVSSVQLLLLWLLIAAAAQY
jgi:hypothetical protein